MNPKEQISQKSKLTSATGRNTGRPTGRCAADRPPSRVSKSQSAWLVPLRLPPNKFPEVR